MTKHHPQALFNEPFNVETWKYFLVDYFGVRDIYESPRELPSVADEKRYLLGEFTTPDDYRIGLFHFEILSRSVTHSKIGLRKLVERYLTSDYDAALVAFTATTDKVWRLSFVCDIKDNETSPKRFTYTFGDDSKTYRTATKRFDELKPPKGESVSFSKIKDTFSVEELSNEFYKELFGWFQWALSKDARVHFPNFSGGQKVNEEQIIRLITRLVFVWFIKQKKLVPDVFFDVDWLKKILENFDEENMENGCYYNAILQNLFFATLNNEIEKRSFATEHRNVRNYAEDYGIKTLFRNPKGRSWFKISNEEVLECFKTVPFLNGGLFECLDKETSKSNGKIVYNDGFSREPKKQAFIPNALFFSCGAGGGNSCVAGSSKEGIIPLLSRYNFTIEENSPDDAEVALDPELLGKVFENLLGAYNPETRDTARKQSGSFYTPREIVNYMVDESLRVYLMDVASNDVVVSLFSEDELPKNITDDRELCRKLSERLKRVKILDPACGSGAFPMGILNRVVALLQKLQLEGENIHDLKLHIIENCIYGADIQTIAVQISKLRFFISLICEETPAPSRPHENYGISPLPNLETKFVAANTLIMLEKKLLELISCDDAELHVLRDSLLETRHLHFSSKTVAEKRRYRSKDAELRERMKKRLQEIATVPDIEKIHMFEAELKQQKKTRKTVENELFTPLQNPPEKDLFGIVPRSGNTGELSLFIDQNKAKRDEIDKNIRKLEVCIAKENSKTKNPAFVGETEQLAQWNPYDQNASSPFFDPEWMFGEKDGFDIVIGNPPYIRIQGLRQSDVELADRLKVLYKAARGSFDVYVTFVERGLSLTRDGGIVNYIMPVKWTNSSFGKGLREVVIKKNALRKIINFGAHQVFNASTYTGIQWFKSGSTSFCYAELDKDLRTKEELFSFLKKDVNSRFVSKELGSLSAEPWVLSTGCVSLVLDKLSKNERRLSDIFDPIFQGLATSRDDVYFIYECKSQDNEIIGFSKELQQIVRIEREFTKPLLKGNDVHRYKRLSSDKFVLFPYEIRNGKAVLYSENTIEKHFPLAYSYLKKCEQVLRDRENGRFNSDGNWFQFARKQGLNFGGVEKLVAPEISLGGNFSYDKNGEFYSTTTIYGYIKKKSVHEDVLSYLAVLNSKLLWWYIKHTGTVLANGYFRYKPSYLNPFPIPSRIDHETQQLLRMHVLDSFVSQEHANQNKPIIDSIIYDLYSLTKSEIDIIEQH